MTNLGVANTKNNDLGDNKKPSQSDKRKEDRMRGRIIDERTRDTSGDGHREIEGEEIEEEDASCQDVAGEGTGGGEDERCIGWFWL